jgi:glycosyltransferase involved in cell wall biosynthesis
MEDVRAAAPAEPASRLFTVGIPVFNGKSLLRNCLQSVITSTFPRDRFEILVADDGSTEPETLAILAEFERELASDPGLFRVLTLPSNSGGAARPRNRILDEAVGEYVFFVDADDTIGQLALERIAEALETGASTPDWIALNQVPMNGRATVARIRQPYAEVPRAKALSTLTVHKVFRRAEIERQKLRFDERLPSGQDVAFSFSYVLNAKHFVMLGGYDYYYLTQHGGNPNEPGHLSRRADTPEAVIEKNERILRNMLTALRDRQLPDAERRDIVGRVVLPRFLARERYLRAVANAGPETGARALRRLAELFKDPLVADLDPAELQGLSPEQFALIAEADWPALAQLVSPASDGTPEPAGVRERWIAQGRRWFDRFSGRARHRQVVHELLLLRRSMENMRDEQRRLEALLDAELHKPDPQR